MARSSSKQHAPSANICLQPTPEQSSRITKKSWRYWRNLLHSATSTNEYPQCCFNIHALLNQTPTLPAHSNIREDIGNTICLEGNAEWDIGYQNDCSLQCATKYSRLQKIPISTRHPNFCRLTREGALTWTLKHRKSESSVNYLAIFVLGWSYVLSARLVELRKKSPADNISYTDNRAHVRVEPQKSYNHQAYSVVIGNVATGELRWWASILAPGCGWRAVLSRSSCSYYPPWSCHLDEGQCFEIIHPNHLENLEYIPPTSSEAQKYLRGFASANNATQQLQIALAACLTLPSQSRFGASIELPHPNVGFPRSSMPISTELALNEGLMPHYMALSCIPNIIPSSMFGCFWEPGVTCNLANAWFHPAHKLIDSIGEEERPQIIARMMALHRPNSAPLWLGAAVTGLAPTLLRFITEHLPPISLEATVWTKSMQCFLDPQFHRVPPMYKDEDGRSLISREDEFRLLYVTDVESRRYPSPPLSPWPPPGAVDIKSTTLGVQRHVKCAHKLLYKQWIWQVQDGLAFPDPGFTSSISHSALNWGSLSRLLRSQISRFLNYSASFRQSVPDYTFNETLSRSATRCVFQWSLSDGVRPDDRELWEQEWLRDILEEDSDDEEGNSEASSQMTG